MPKQPSEYNQPLIVQFIHPGPEYRVAKGMVGEPVDIPWVGKPGEPKCCKHSRRLVCHDGEYIDTDGTVKTSRLAFWTEWEAETIAIRMPPPPRDEDERLFAEWIHTVKSPLKASRVGTQNTDPCVFGSTFKYCCCQQTKATLRNLAPGSLVLFGSHLAEAFVLDTVFVVNERRIPYETGGCDTLPVSKAYRELALDRLDKGYHYTFYRGEPFCPSNENGMYSFVPARPFAAGDTRCGERFALDVKEVNRCFPPSSRKIDPDLSRFFWKVPASPKTILEVWKLIVEQVRRSEFVPGVHFDWP